MFCFDLISETYPIVGAVLKRIHVEGRKGYSYESIESWTEEGTSVTTNLFMAPVKHQSWMNVYHRAGVTSAAGPFPTEEYAITTAESVANSEYYKKTVLMHEWEE